MAQVPEKDGAQAFASAYAALNAEQRAAVDAIEGPVFVIAGPGTGKTQVLTLRIANILRTTDTPPDGILALTFTDSAVRTLRARLISMIGERAYRVRVHTFHSFAQHLVTAHPDAFPQIIGAELATDAERSELLERALLNTPVEHLRPLGDPLYYHGHIERAIGTLKREHVGPEELLTRTEAVLCDFAGDPEKFHQSGKYAGQMKGAFAAEKKRLEKTVDLARVYAAYEALRIEARRYDYNDLIIEAVRALTEDADLRLQVQEATLYVLADEHQDANRAQNALLELVSGFHERPNLFIVGDEKQAIYRFQGADLDNVHAFRGQYPDATIIALVENYRSTQPILDSARSLIVASPDERLSRVSLIGNAPHAPELPELLVCPDEHTQYEQLAAGIRTAQEEGVPADEIAVLVRRNSDVETVTRALLARGVAASAGNDADVFGNRHARALLRLLSALAEPSDAAVGAAFILPGFGIAAADLQRVIAAARAARVPLLEFARSPERVAEAEVRNAEAIVEAAKTLAALAATAGVERPAAVAEQALGRSGLLALVLAAPDRLASLGAIGALIRSFEDLSRREHDALLPRALETLARLEARGARLPSAAEEQVGAVRVMTVHRAKGREFSRVFLPLLTARSWSTRTRASHFELPGVLSGSVELEDERRLLYVGLTRAKERTTLLYACLGEDGREEEPSELLADIDPTLIQVREVPAAEPWIPGGAEAVRTDEPSATDRQALIAAFMARAFSASALNDYLACPWRYFYTKLIRIPEVEKPHMLKGTAIHAALEQYARQRARGEDIGVPGLIAVFERTLARSPLSSGAIADLRAEGVDTLTTWWKERHAQWPAEATPEELINAQMTLDDGEVLRLTGKLDLAVRLPGGVRVIDYKTGKAKSANDIRGLTKTGTGDYYRQLAFYQLLLARKEDPERMLEGVIEFVVPDEKGRIISHAFEISAEDIAELETTIRRVADDIRTLAFWNQHCDDTDCAYCGYRFALDVQS